MLVTHSRAVVSLQQPGNHTYRTSPQTFEKHWCIPYGLHPISCSGFKPFQPGICPSHSAENAIEKVTDLLMAKFGRFFFLFSSYVTSLQHLTPFASVTLRKLCSLIYLTTPSFQAFLLLPTPWGPFFMLHSHRLLLDNLIDVLCLQLYTVDS